MRLIGITLDQFHQAVATANSTYGGNLSVQDDSHSISSNSCVARVVAKSRENGARTSWTGRNGPYACWHAYRDVLRACFDINPDAKIYTTLARYKGSQGFEETYPSTAYNNVGSMINPTYMTELCVGPCQYQTY
jgi:hypothetical protein